MISVIMAVYNGERDLKEAIESVLAQTFDDFELIIVNDGSTDRTREILNQFEYEDKIKVVHLSRNSGAANALNIAAGLSKGEWIAVHDADDLSCPTRLAEQYQFLMENRNISVLGSLIECINGDPPVSEEFLKTQEKSYNSFQTVEELRNTQFYGNPVCHGSVMYSRELFNQVGGYNPKYKIAYDYDLWMKMRTVGSIAKIPRVLYKWRVHEKSLHRKDENQTCLEVLRISAEHIKNLLYYYNQSMNVAVIGPEKGCKQYASLVKPLEGFRIKEFIQKFSPAELNKLYRRIQIRDIDGVIVLESDWHYKALDDLVKRGLIYNYNMFFLWNVFK